jgi:Flp pilus assembly protein TadD
LISQEGRPVRKSDFAHWATQSVAAGLLMTGGWSIGAAAEPYAFGQPPQPQRTWSQRLMAPFAGSPDPAQQQRDAVAVAQEAEARRLAFDPLALSNGSGEASPELFVGMADLTARGGNISQARQFYQKALAMEPNHLEALLGAARMEDREGHLDVAGMLYQRAATTFPNNATVLNDLGLCLARQGQLPGAERALLRAVQLLPAKPLYRNNLAKVQIEMNRLDEAASQLAAVYAPPVVNYNMGVLLYQRGRNAEAERYLNAAIAVDQRMDPARALLAHMHPAAPVYQVAQVPQATQGPLMISAPVPTAVAPAAPAPTIAPVSEPPAQMVDTGAPSMPEIDNNVPTLLPPVN